ncbi:MAG: hypothetical protein Q9214_002738 [Letrouitia sp. 1 TL-2023]
MAPSNKKDGDYEIVVVKKNGRLQKERRRIHTNPPGAPTYEEYTSLKSELAMFIDRLKSCEHALHEADTDRQYLRRERDALQANYGFQEEERNELQDKLKVMKGKHKTLKDTSSRLEEKNDILRRKNNSLQEANENLKRDYRDMRYGYERAEDDLQSLRDECYRRGWLWDSYRRFRRR